MAKEQSKGLLEKGAGFFEKLHYAIGGVALIGAVALPEIASPLAVFGAYEIVHGVLWTFIKNGVSKSPKRAPA
ncbi:MAG TPA: hypothetical protein VLF88_02050 [Candidatus Babeliales bacterium]|nr:hypothetical protein [Candidatus Babeliales bacterium]